MTGILEEKSDFNNRMKKSIKEDNWISIFEQEKQSLQAIENFAWMQLIKKYWELQKDIAIHDMSTIPSNEWYKIAEAQAKYKLAEQFERFLKNRS